MFLDVFLHFTGIENLEMHLPNKKLECVVLVSLQTNELKSNGYNGYTVIPLYQ